MMMGGADTPLDFAAMICRDAATDRRVYGARHR
jgi:hypothetical protein